MYDKRRGITPYSKYHGYAYDGIWTIALALDHVIKTHMTSRRYRRYSLNDVGDADGDNDIVFGFNQTTEALNLTDFIGVTVRIEFRDG